MIKAPSFVHPDIFSISNDFDGFLLDAYGVFWAGNAVGMFPGCQEKMKALVDQGKIVGILSNATQLAENEIQKVKKHGLHLGEHFHFYLTSGEVTRSIFFQKQLPFPVKSHLFWVLGEIHPKFSSHNAIFAGTGYEETDSITEADFIYISIPHIGGEDQLDPTFFYDQVKSLLKYNLPMLCINPDRFAYEGNPPKPVVRQGSIADMYEKLGGKVFYIGKPTESMYTVGMQKFSEYHLKDVEKILMVGDTPETDIRGAHYCHMPSALVIDTGMVAGRVRDLGWEKFLLSLPQQDKPTFYINRF